MADQNMLAADRGEQSELTKKDFALDHAKRGWRVIPLVPNEKKAYLKDWPEQATTDPGRIDEWWSRQPDANIGIVCGRESDLCVIDFDTEDGTDRIESTYGRLPESVWVETPRGYHLYLAYADGVRTTIGKFLEGIDTKSDRGYVVAPGSVVDGHTYQFVVEPEDFLPLAEPPDWLMQSGSSADTMVWYGPNGQLAIAPADGQVSDILCERIIQVRSAMPGTRNTTLNTAALWAGRLVGAGRLDRTHAEDQLLAAAHDAGLPDLEARATIRSGLEAGIRDPLYSKSAVDAAPRLGTGGGVRSEGFVMKVVADYANEAPSATFWDRRLARGAITVLAGDGGVGKSTVAACVMAAITGNGSLLGWGEGDETPHGSVAIVSFEDSGRVIEARNTVLGADNRRVINIEGRKYVDADGNHSFNPITTADIRDLAVELQAIPELVLLIIDPWKDLVVDINKPDIVNPALTALATLAGRLDIAVLLIAHHNAEGGLAGYKGLQQKARSVLECKQLEATDSVTKVAMAQTKSNLGAKAPTLLFEHRTLPDKRGWHTGDNPFAWAGTSTMSGDYLLRQKKRTRVQEAEDWLRSTLINDQLSWENLTNLASDENLTEHTLRRARDNVCESFQVKGSHLWRLK